MKENKLIPYVPKNSGPGLLLHLKRKEPDCLSILSALVEIIQDLQSISTRHQSTSQSLECQVSLMECQAIPWPGVGKLFLKSRIDFLASKASMRSPL